MTIKELNLGQLLPFLEDLFMETSHGVREEKVKHQQ